MMNKSSYMYIIQKNINNTNAKINHTIMFINYTIVQLERNYNGTLKNIEQNRVNRKVEHST